MHWLQDAEKRLQEAEERQLKKVKAQAEAEEKKLQRLQAKVEREKEAEQARLKKLQDKAEREVRESEVATTSFYVVSQCFCVHGSRPRSNSRRSYNSKLRLRSVY